MKKLYFPFLSHVANNLLITKDGFLVSVFQVVVNKESYINNTQHKIVDFFHKFVEEFPNYLLWIYYDSISVDISGRPILVGQITFAMVLPQKISYTDFLIKSLFSSNLIDIFNHSINLFSEDIKKLFQMASSFNIDLRNLQATNISEPLSFFYSILLRENIVVEVNEELLDDIFEIEAKEYLTTVVSGRTKYHAMISVKSRGRMSEVWKFILNNLNIVVVEVILNKQNIIKEKIYFADIYKFENTENSTLNAMIFHLTANSKEELMANLDVINYLLRDLSFVVETIMAEAVFIAQIPCILNFLERVYVSSFFTQMANVINYSYGVYKNTIFTEPIAIFEQKYGKNFFFNFAEEDHNKNVIVMTSEDQAIFLNIIYQNIVSKFNTHGVLICSKSSNTFFTNGVRQKLKIFDKKSLEQLKSIISASADNTIANCDKVKDAILFEIDNLKEFDFEGFANIIKKYDLAERKIFDILYVIISYFSKFFVENNNKQYFLSLEFFSKINFTNLIITNYSNLFFFLNKMEDIFDQFRYFILYNFLNNWYASQNTYYHIFLYDIDYLLDCEIKQLIQIFAERTNISLWINLNTSYVKYSDYNSTVSYFNKMTSIKVLTNLDINIDRALDASFFKLKTRSQYDFLIIYHDKHIFLNMRGNLNVA